MVLHLVSFVPFLAQEEPPYVLVGSGMMLGGDVWSGSSVGTEPQCASPRRLHLHLPITLFEFELWLRGQCAIGW